METAWVEICKAGTWTAKNGAAVTLTHADLDGIVSAYNPALREAPLVLGHPKENHPAYGWATALKRSGDILMAKFKQVPDAVKKLVTDGHYKKVSIALMPDKKTLRHVGLLGAAQPAVPGLSDVKFSGEEDAVVLEFSTPPARAGNTIEKGEHMPTVEELEKKLAAEKAARETAERAAADATALAAASQTELTAQKAREADAVIETRLNALIGKKILPAEKPAVKAVALALGKTGDEIELSAGSGKKPMIEHLFDFLAGLPDRGLLTEFSATAPAGNDDKGVLKNLTACV